MTRIQKLGSDLANQIAAGEVVERPVSVVKELVENSIDAGATQISIELELGGIKSIRVADNGQGIHPEDMQLSLEKYSTSKIAKLDDLYNLSSFGFRGEALSSIASVSEFSLASKIAVAQSGIQIINRNNSGLEIREIARDTGTAIEVKNLFYNTPARLNYLKKPRTEYLKISEFLQKMALCKPEIAFELIHDEKKIFHYSANQTRAERIFSIYGEEFLNELQPIDTEIYGIRLSGYISNPKISYGNKTKQHMYVNERVITSPIIIKAISDAYNRYIPHGTYSSYILFVDIDPSQIDINVHPRKMEVRFAAEQQIFKAVHSAISQKLESESLVDPALSPAPAQNYFQPQQSTAEKTPQYYSGSGTKFKNYSPYKDTSPNPAQAAIEFSKNIMGSGESHPRGENMQVGDIRETPLGYIIGQIHKSYIVLETMQGIKILDQHALAERVIYEKLAHSAYTPKVQQLLSAMTLRLSPAQLQTLENYSENLAELGFDIDILAHGNVALHGIPDFVKKENITQVFENILDDISQIGSVSLQEIRNKIWAYAACRSAVKFGDSLSVFEMRALLLDASTDYSVTCPHGRPVVFEMNLDELQKKYER